MRESSLPVGVEEGLSPPWKTEAIWNTFPPITISRLRTSWPGYSQSSVSEKQGKDLPGGKLLQGDFLRLVRAQHPGILQGFPVLLFLLHPLASFSP